jgi:hypothetical protein
MIAKNEKLAYELGYRVVDGVPYSYTGRQLKINSSSGYEVFDITVGKRSTGDRHNVKIFIHRMVAYQKYGDELYEHEVVRHLDDNGLNNSGDNLALGSHENNRYDMPPNKRLKFAVNASQNNRKFSDNDMDEIRRFHNGSYKETMEQFDISSKGTLWYILNKDYITKK